MELTYSHFSDAMSLLSVEHHRFVECNDATLALFGYTSREEFFARTPWDLSPEFQPDGESSRTKAMRILALTMETGSHYFDWLHVRKDGTEVHCIVLLSRITHDGKTYIQTTCRDVTREKTALRQLQTQQHEMNQIMEALNQTALVCWTDAEGRITDVNDYYCIQCGYRREELIGETHEKLIPPGRPPELRAQMLEVLAQGKHWTGILNNQAKDGSIYWVNTVITPIRDMHGKIMKYLSIQTDLTRLTETQNKLNHAQEVARMGSWEFHFESNSFTGSQNFFRLYEVSPDHDESALADCVKMRVHPDDMPLVNAAMKESLETGNDYNVRHRLLFDDGSIKYFDCRANLVRDRMGTRFLGTAADVTETVFREEKMKQLLNFNRTVMDSADAILVTVDRDGVLTGMNEHSVKMLGYQPEELVGKSTSAIFHLREEMMQATLELNREFGLNLAKPCLDTFTYRARNGVTDSRQWTLVRKDGTNFQARLSITPLRDSQGAVYGFVGIARDLTQELAIREALEFEKAKSLHNAKLASLGEMAAGVAHEINNPLAMIVGSAELLETAREDAAKFQKKIDIIRRASGRIEKIVKGLQKFARTTGTTEFSVVDLRTVIQDALILVEGKARRHDVTISFEAQGDAAIYCDAVEIEQVIVNLLNNGIDAIKELPERWIRMEVHSSPTGVTLRVVDAGKGISHDVEPKLFQPFFTTKPVGEGTGLGLSIVKGILDQHRASIRLNRAEKNTCFELDFPRAPTPRNEASLHGA
ncbi:MAG: PAS domain S-box protein [Bdellovibrionaceae bacterium]|nr:PAS domain S-box protein [Pseudobdellovibrionaceae bacterium]